VFVFFRISLWKCFLSLLLRGEGLRSSVCAAMIFSFPVRGSCFLPDKELHDVVVAWIVGIAEAAAVRARRKPGGTVV
jgi:hypothetical protein